MFPSEKRFSKETSEVAKKKSFDLLERRLKIIEFLLNDVFLQNLVAQLSATENRNEKLIISVSLIFKLLY